MHPSEMIKHVDEISMFLENGRIIHHQKLKIETPKKRKDNLLVTGFIAGIVAFSRQLGSEPSTIAMKDHSYHLWQEGPFIFALRTTSFVKEQDAQFIFSLITSHPEYSIIRKKSISNDEDASNKTYEILQNSFKKIINDTLMTAHQQQDEVVVQNRHLAILSDVFQKILHEKVSAEYICDKILASTIKRKDQKLIEKTIQWLEILLKNDSLNLNDDTKKMLKDAISYLKNKDFYEPRKIIYASLLHRKGT